MEQEEPSGSSDSSNIDAEDIEDCMEDLVEEPTKSILGKRSNVERDTDI